MKKMIVRHAMTAPVFLLCGTMLFGQGILRNDTLYIGNVSTCAGQQVEVPVYMKTTMYYQGWTFPMTFGDGTSPVTCDSVSLAGTTMESWAWTSVFVNNNQWDDVQTCGGTGIYAWFGDSLSPGYYSAMRLFFTVDANVNPPLTIPIDTTTCSFASGGQQNGFLVVVNLQSWLTIVVPGSIEIGLPGINENNKTAVQSQLNVYPSIARHGSIVRISCTIPRKSLNKISLYDIKGAKIDELYYGIPEHETVDIDYRIEDLAKGVYIVFFEDDTGTQSRKIIIN
ncbi:MAG: T9SS type A sorting domain-containing protein [bacterium]